ncbi:MAG: hypothetical protein AAF502_01840 [Bacteroidota bacterium]
MNLKLINLPWFREKVKQNYAGSPFSEAPREFLFEKPYSRRNFLKLFGLAPVVYGPVVNTLGKILSPGFEIIKGNGFVSFRVKGKDCWTINETWFEGSPRLSIKEEKKYISVRLKNAKFPGTPVTADFICQISRTDKGWSVETKFKQFGDFQSRNFVKWLKGNSELNASKSIAKDFCHFTHGNKLRVSGNVIITFSSDWSFTLKRLSGIKLSWEGNSYLADELSLVLNSGNPQSGLSATPLEKDCFFTLKKRKGKFDQVGSVKLKDNQKLVSDRIKFEEIFIETGCDEKGTKVITLLQQSSKAKGARFYPDTRLVSNTKKPLRFNLVDYHNVIAVKNEQVEKACIAKLGKKAVHLNLKGSQFSFGRSSDQVPALEITNIAASNFVHFAPTLLSSYISVRKAMGMIFPEIPEKKAIFQGMVNRELLSEDQNLQEFNLVGNTWKTQNNSRVTIPVLRAEDMVVLILDFSNFELDLDTLTINKLANKKGLLSVYLPPQHFGEQAFFTAQNAEIDLPPGDPDAAASEEYPTFLPIQYRMANLSRLVFKVPDEVTSFTADMDDLLGWADYTMSIHPRGLSSAGNSGNQGYIFKPFDPKDFQLKPDVLVIPDTQIEVPQRKPGRVKPSQKKPSRGRLTLPKQKQKERQKEKPPIEARVDPNRITTFQEAARLPDKSVLQSEVRPIQVNPELLQVVPVFKDSFKKPRYIDTFIEAPYRLYISPNEKHRWIHKTQLVDLKKQSLENELKDFEADYKKIPTYMELYEVWTTRAGINKGGKALEANRRNPLKFRALWSKDANEDYKLVPQNNHWQFRSSLSPKDRHKLVHQTSNFKMPKDGGGQNVIISGSPYRKPLPFNVNSFIMSSYGALIDFNGAWKNMPVELNILSWIHRSTLGRDHYVRVVYSGYLFPFGNKASLVKITERKVDARNSEFGAIALNFQRMYIQVKEPFMDYPGFANQGAISRMHFKNIFIKNKRTPNINDPLALPSKIIDGAEDGAFWINVNNAPFQFNLTAEDQEGREIDFQVPMIFVSTKISEVASEAGNRQTIQTNYRNNSLNNTADLQHQMMALAPFGEKKGDTSFETISIKFGSFQDGTDNAENAEPERKIGKVRFFPVLRETEIDSTPINNLTGSKDFLTIIPFVDQNDGKIFATLKTGKGLEFEKGAEKSGGIITPSLNIGALSSKFGPVGSAAGAAAKDSEFLKNGNFDPLEFFQGAAPKLFGSIDLASIIQAIGLLDNGAAEKVPKLVQKILNEGLPDATLEISYNWQPDLQNVSIGLLEFVPNDIKGLTLNTKVSKKLAGGDPKVDLVGEMSDFFIRLVEIVQVDFQRVYFKSYNGKKPDVGTDLGEITFLGPLKFLNALQNLIPMDGFSDPPFVNITPTGVDVGFTMAIPDVQTGVFTLRSMKLGALLQLPLLGGEPLSLRFNFCERNNPFVATVSFIGGGGFFALTFTLAGLQKIEAAIEFGASLSINLGVASGGVYIMGGVYFSMETNNGDSTIFFQGYIKMGGHLSVLAIISVSVEFKMSLNYESQPGPPSKGQQERVWGEATLKVKIEVLFFSKTVSMTAKRELKSAEADPIFTDLISENDWATYCAAFA